MPLNKEPNHQNGIHHVKLFRPMINVQSVLDKQITFPTHVTFNLHNDFKSMLKWIFITCYSSTLFVINDTTRIYSGIQNLLIKKEKI